MRCSTADAIVDASPARLDRMLKLSVPIARVRYRFEERSGPSIFALVQAAGARGKQ
jgi:hypothetical protein